MIICISGNYRSGKSGFGVEISKKLGIKYYSMRVLAKEEKTKYNTDFVDWSEKIELLDNKLIDIRIMELARQGNCLLDFRYAAMLCKKSNIDYIGIWITSSIASRIYGNSYCWKKSEEETEKIILNRELYEKDISKKNYGLDFSSKEYYHYFVDLSPYWYPISVVSKEGFKFGELIDQYFNTLRER